MEAAIHTTQTRALEIPGSNKWWFVRIVNSLQRHMHNQGRYSDRRPLCRCLLASEKPTASPRRSPEILFASAPRAPTAGLFLSSRLCAKAATQSDKSKTLSKMALDSGQCGKPRMANHSKIVRAAQGMRNRAGVLSYCLLPPSVG